MSATVRCGNCVQGIAATDDGCAGICAACSGYGWVTPPDPRDATIARLTSERDGYRGAAGLLETTIERLTRELQAAEAVVGAARELSAKYATSGDSLFVLLRAALDRYDTGKGATK